jgi:hypothetical protein
MSLNVIRAWRREIACPDTTRGSFASATPTSSLGGLGLQTRLTWPSWWAASLMYSPLYVNAARSPDQNEQSSTRTSRCDYDERSQRPARSSHHAEMLNCLNKAGSTSPNISIAPCPRYAGSL